MHDDRVHVERRITRMLTERLRPAVYPDPVPLLLESWHAPGEPVPVAEGLAAPYSETKAGERWGPPWGTTWFQVTGTVPARVGRPEVEAVVDLGSPATGPASSRGPGPPRPDGTPVKALNPLQPLGAGRATPPRRRAGRPVRRGRLQPRHPRRRRRDPPRGHADRRRRAALPRRRVDLAVFDERSGSSCTTSRCSRADGGAAHRLAPPLARSCARWSGPWTPSTWHDVAGTARRRPRRARPGARRARRTPARTGSAPSATRTSTRPGCGRCARPCARSPAPSPTSPR